MDGRGFSRFTERRFDKPFDVRFSDLMVTTAHAVLTELGGRRCVV
jgi:tRNA(His) 5'-end guanylyltransferase